MKTLAEKYAGLNEMQLENLVEVGICEISQESIRSTVYIFEDGSTITLEF